MPSVVNWIGGLGNWNDASHWLDATTGTNHTPAPADDAVIDVDGVTVSRFGGDGLIVCTPVGSTA